MSPTKKISPLTLRRVTQWIVAWVALSVIALYIAAVCTDTPESSSTGPPPLSDDTTLSGVLIRPPLRVAGGVLLGLALAALVSLEPLRDLPWPRSRLMIAIVMLATWVAVVLYPMNAMRNECPIRRREEEEVRTERKMKQTTHWIFAAVFIFSTAVWVWVHCRLSKDPFFRNVWIGSLIAMLGFVVCFVLHFRKVYSITTLKHLCAAMEALQLLVFLSRMARWITRQSAATPAPGAAASDRTARGTTVCATRTAALRRRPLVPGSARMWPSQSSHVALFQAACSWLSLGIQ